VPFSSRIRRSLASVPVIAGIVAASKPSCVDTATATANPSCGDAAIATNPSNDADATYSAANPSWAAAAAAATPSTTTATNPSWAAAADVPPSTAATNNSWAAAAAEPPSTTATNPSVLSGVLLLVALYGAWPWLFPVLLSAVALAATGGSLLLQLPVVLVGQLFNPAVGLVFVYLAACLVFLQGMPRAH
jgi:hypothetical protein